jgi:hypothetical protein
MDSRRACKLSLNGSLWGHGQSPAAVTKVLESVPNAPGLPAPCLSLFPLTLPIVFCPGSVSTFSSEKWKMAATRNLKSRTGIPNSGHTLPRETLFPSEQGHSLGQIREEEVPGVSPEHPHKCVTSTTETIFLDLCSLVPLTGKDTF